MKPMNSLIRFLLVSLACSIAVIPAFAQGVVGRGEPLTLAVHADAMARAAICGIGMSERGIAETALGLQKLTDEAGIDAEAASKLMASVEAELRAANIDCDRNAPDMIPAYEVVVFYEDRARRADNQSLLLDSLNAALTLVGTIEYCQIPIEGNVAARMGTYAIELETNLSMSDEESAALYEERLEELRAAKLDCSEGGSVRANIAKAVGFFGG